MICVGLGANIRSPLFGSPLATCRAAVLAMPEFGIHVRRCSRWYRSRPVPVSRQPTYVNGVVVASSHLGPPALLAALHAIETAFGRRRTVRNAPRVLDLDLLVYGTRVWDGTAGVALPHPRLHERAFVLYPLSELVPDWTHPQSGAPIADMIAGLADQDAEPMAQP